MSRVERIRVGLVAGSVLLLMVLAGAYSYARYRAGKAWFDRGKKLLESSLVHETDGYTFSHTLGPDTSFTLHAAKTFQHANGQWTLHDVVIDVYEKHENRTDRIYGNNFEWDENQGIARAIGEVQMDLQVPSSAASVSRHGSPATAGGAENIHVKTSGMVFLRKLGVAATSEQIEFTYKGLTCVAKGGELDNNPNSLHLFADVRMNTVMHGKPVVLNAVKADIDRDSNVVSFVRPVLVTADKKGHADEAVLHLRKDGSVERGEATGNVELDTATQQVTSPRLDATLTNKNVLETARFSGGVKLVDVDAKRPMQGEAGEARLRFDAVGRVQEITAVGHAHLLARQVDSSGASLGREMRGDQIVADFHAEGKGKAQLQKIHATGTASMRGESLAKAVGTQPRGLKSTSVAGDDLLANFVADGLKKMRIDKLHGVGHTFLRQTAPLAEEHTSSGDSLDVVFAAGGAQKVGAAPSELEQVSVASATQVGHVAISNHAALKPGSKKAQDVSSGSADRAAYDGESEKLALSGSVHLVDAGTSVIADSVMVDQRTEDSEAHGNVAATLTGSAAATHVTAQSAFLHKATEVAEFDGSAAKPARLWQDASQVEAATITVDRQKKTLVARPATAGGTVHSVFAGVDKPGAVPKSDASKAPNILRVESRLLEYSDAQHDAVFTGPVKIDGSMGEVRGQRTIAFFTPPAPKDSSKSKGDDMGLMGGQLDHVLVTGDVKLEEPGKHGTGEQLVYKAADGSFVLTGTPSVMPRIVDAQQGTVTGASLLFRAGDKGDSTIVVTGTPAEQKPQRVHIETHVRQKAE
jgi:lipopolysaccharide export system protein LptA